ncbi:MAG: ribonuclease III [Candidatus Ancillula sp.]|nr:ribonuclease III [Candidatus Ancillula sp.]
MLNAKELLGVDIDAEIFILSLTHRSFSNENGGCPTNERLEFLGDAVLELAITKKIFHDYPDQPEGALTKIRSAVVSEPPLAKVAKDLGIGKLVLLGKGEDLNGGREKASILSDAFEAILGAIYLTNGFEVAEKFILDKLGDILEDVVEHHRNIDTKSQLQALAHKLNKGEVLYAYDSFGPDHQKRYKAAVSFEKSPDFIASAEADSKKKASLLAAQKALEKLQVK